MSSLPTKEFRTSYHDHVRHDVVPHIPKSGGQLLDLGGGIGATAAEVRRLGLVDQAGVADMIDNSIEDTKLDFTFQGNFEDPSFLDNIVEQRGKFQMILALDILEHLLDPWTMAKRLADSLDEGGYMVVSIPNVRNFRASVPLLLQNKWDYQDDGILDRTHLRFFVRSTAIDLMEQTGLKITKVTPSASGGRAVRLFRAVTFGLLNSLTDRQYIIVAQKV